MRFLEEPQAFQRHNIQALQEAIADNEGSLRHIFHRTTRQGTEIVEGKELITRPEAHRLLILGKPGAGKTTFLQHLALDAAKGTLEKLPIFVALREWQEVGDYESLLDFIARQFDICEFPNARPVVEFFLRHVDTLVLFDGLDEVPEEGDRRGLVIDALRDFARKYPKPQILITCRIAATDYTFRGFKYVDLADFNEGQIHAFVRKWFREEEKLAEQFWKEYRRKENQRLRELGQVPILLALLCLSYEETLSFPRRRVDLYEEALDALLKKWDAARRIRRDEIYEKLSLGRKHQMLAHLAAKSFQESEYFFSQRELADRIANHLRKLPPASPNEDIDGEGVLKAIEAQHGVLVERAHHIYAFAHLTFQEYYTAKYVVDNAIAGTIPRLMEHIAEDRWNEVFLLTASLLSKADPFFEYFLKALNCLVRENGKLTEILIWVEHKTLSMESAYQSAMFRVLYLNLVLTSASSLALTRASASTGPLVRASYLTRKIAEILGNEFSLGNFPHFELDLALTRVRMLDRSLNYAIGCAQGLHMGRLASDLENLEVPTSDTPPKKWQDFIEDLRILMIQQRDIGYNWQFTWEQAHTLERYLSAVRLFVECLNVAYVTDRKAIEDRLLRPPQQSK